MLIIIIIKLIFKAPLCLIALAYNLPASTYKKNENYNPRSKKFTYSYNDFLKESRLLPITKETPIAASLLIFSYAISYAILALLILAAIVYKLLTIFLIHTPLHLPLPTSKLQHKIVGISKTINHKSLLTTSHLSENTIMTIICFNSPPTLLYKTLITQKSLLEVYHRGLPLTINLTTYIFTTI